MGMKLLVIAAALIAIVAAESEAESQYYGFGGYGLRPYTYGSYGAYPYRFGYNSYNYGSYGYNRYGYNRLYKREAEAESEADSEAVAEPKSDAESESQYYGYHPYGMTHSYYNHPGHYYGFGGYRYGGYPYATTYGAYPYRHFGKREAEAESESQFGYYGGYPYGQSYAVLITTTQDTVILDLTMVD